jgi:hypothetical protein
VPLEITVTVKTDNNFDETVITKTLTDGNANPRFDGSNASTLGAEAVGHVVVQLNRLVDSPLIADGTHAITLVRQTYLQELQRDADTLAKLRAAGVDNWEGYDEATRGEV